MLDCSRYWSTLARWHTDWTYQPASARRYKDFTTFFMSVFYATTGPMYLTMKCHQWKLMAKNSTKLKLFGSIGSFVARCSFWSNGLGMMNRRTYDLPPVNWTRQRKFLKPTEDKIYWVVLSSMTWVSVLTVTLCMWIPASMHGSITSSIYVSHAVAPFVRLDFVLELLSEFYASH